MNNCDMNYIEILKNKIIELEAELEDARHKSNGDEKLLRHFARTCNELNRENEVLREQNEALTEEKDDYSELNEYLNNKINILEEELDIAIEGQKDFKKIIVDLEAINREVMDEMREANKYKRLYIELLENLH